MIKFTSSVSKILTLVFLFATTMAFSQITGVKYSLVYNPQTNTHDVYLIVHEGSGAISPLQRTQFNSQFTIVTPLGISVAIKESFNPIIGNVSYNGTKPLNWAVGSIVSNTFYSSEFTSITPTLSPVGQYNQLKVGDRVKLFSLESSALLCEGQVRLYENDSDPKAGDIGMQGGDFRNAFTMGSISNIYVGNEKPTILGCPSLHQYFVFSDANSNGIFDAQDSPMPQVKMSIPSLNTTIMSNHAGHINFYSTPGDYTSQIVADYGAWKTSSFNVVARVTDHSTFDTIRFTPSNEIAFGTTLVQTSFLRCNGAANVFPLLQNISSSSLSAKLVATIDKRVVIKSIEPAPSEVNGNVLTWDVVDLAPGFTFKPTIHIKVPQAQSNADSLKFNTQIIDDKGLTSQSHDYIDVIRCSFDPNDKRVWPNRKGAENLTLNTEKLRYTIRFQNNGNDTAFAVKIVDVLDKSLDLRSLTIRDASHEVRPMIKGDTVFFLFDPIALVDSATNYIASQGYVTYEIKPIAGIASNMQIKNTADIIFDSNPPIVTNTTLNTIVDKFPCPADAIWEENFVLLVNQSSSEYSWYDCNNNELLVSTTEPTFRPSKSGSYYCIIAGDYCVTKTGCIAFIVSGTDGNTTAAFSLYPNPSNGLVYIAAGKTIDYIELFDMNGHRVFGAQYLDGQTQKTLTLDHLIPSQYVIKIGTGKDVMVNRLTIVK